MKRKETLVSFNMHRRGIVVRVGHLFCKAYSTGEFHRAALQSLPNKYDKHTSRSTRRSPTSSSLFPLRPPTPAKGPPHALPSPYWLHKQRSLAIQTLNPPCSLLPSLQSPLPSLHRLPFETPARNFSLLANNPEEGASGGGGGN